MAIQREDPYYDIDERHCVVTNCIAPVIAEVFDGDYAAALAIFRGIRRATVRTRRVGDERLFICKHHRDTDPRVQRLQWQDLFAF
jgi:hypothetical protein